MTDHTCPICEEPIENVRRVDSITFVLDPCGHEIDEEVHSDIFG